MPSGRYLTPNTKLVKPRVPIADLRKSAFRWDFSTLNDMFMNRAIAVLTIKATKVRNKHKSNGFMPELFI